MADDLGSNGALTKSVDPTPLTSPVLIPIAGTVRAEPDPDSTGQEWLG
jgi:hypothetical protein